MARHENFDIFNTDYWCLIDEIETDIKIGKLKKNQESMDDSELLEKFIDEFSLERNVEIFYTDGSKQENRNSVGVRIMKEESDMGYKVSINNKCLIYTAEALAIEKVLGLILERQMSRDILILTDSMSVVKKLKDLMRMKMNLYLLLKREFMITGISGKRREIERKIIEKTEEKIE